MEKRRPSTNKVSKNSLLPFSFDWEKSPLPSVWFIKGDITNFIKHFEHSGPDYENSLHDTLNFTPSGSPYPLILLLVLANKDEFLHALILEPFYRLLIDENFWALVYFSIVRRSFLTFKVLMLYKPEERWLTICAMKHERLEFVAFLMDSGLHAYGIQGALVAAATANNGEVFSYLMHPMGFELWDVNEVFDASINEETSNRVKQAIQMHPGLTEHNRNVMNTDGYYGEPSSDDSGSEYLQGQD
jgi:hypothetical protein